MAKNCTICMDLGIENFDHLIFNSGLIEQYVLSSAVPILPALLAPVQINERFNNELKITKNRTISMDYSLGIKNFDNVVFDSRLIEYDVLSSAIPILPALHAPVEINEGFNNKLKMIKNRTIGMDYSLGIENFNIVVLNTRLIEHDILSSAIPILPALHTPAEINEQFNNKLKSQKITL